MTHTNLHRRACLKWGLSAAAWPCLSQGAEPTTGKRVALVIGNASYAKQPLRHAVNDARAVATSLGQMGYQLITCENATLADMLSAMKNFWLQSRDADARVIFFAGHGVVHQGRNYLLPVDATIHSAEDVSRMGAKLDEILDKLATADKGVNVVILDACRTSLHASAGSRFTPTGLEQVVAPRGTLVAFSTAPGAPAFDGNQGNSPYTRHLIAQLNTPGQPIEQMFKRVRQAVLKETKELQSPWENSSLTGDFCFRNGPTGLCPTS
jgi:uncharacterized caspase-like protein